MISWVRRALAVVGIVIILFAFCATAYAAEITPVDVIEATVSEDFVVSLVNPTNKDVQILINLNCYCEDDILYTESIDIILKSHGSKDIDAKEFFDSSRTTNVEVTIQKSDQLPPAVTTFLVIAGLITLIGFVFFLTAAITDLDDFFVFGAVIVLVGVICFMIAGILSTVLS